jgi:hypothetical protein
MRSSSDQQLECGTLSHDEPPPWVETHGYHHASLCDRDEGCRILLDVEL